MTIGNGAITGTLYKNEGWSSGYLKGPGYYLALKFTSNDWSQYDSVKVGLDPSAQSGIIEILNDPDKNGVFKVKQNLSQKFVVEYRKGDAVERDVYDLSGLTLSEEPPTPPTPTGGKEILNVASCDGETAYTYASSSPMPTTTTVTQTITEFDDDTELSEGNYTGTISGTLVSGSVGNSKCLRFVWQTGFIDWLKSQKPEGLVSMLDPGFKINYEEFDSSNQSLGSGILPASSTQLATNDVALGIPIYEGASKVVLDIIAEYRSMDDVPYYDYTKEFVITYTVSFT